MASQQIHRAITSKRLGKNDNGRKEKQKIAQVYLFISLDGEISFGEYAVCINFLRKVNLFFFLVRCFVKTKDGKMILK